MTRERPKALNLTDAAAERVKELMASRDAGFLRVAIVVDGKSLLFLLGSTIDYETTTLHSKFVFRNPNETDACGCGESVTLVAATLDR